MQTLYFSLSNMIFASFFLHLSFPHSYLFCFPFKHFTKRWFPFPFLLSPLPPLQLDIKWSHRPLIWSKRERGGGGNGTERRGSEGDEMDERDGMEWGERAWAIHIYTHGGHLSYIHTYRQTEWDMTTYTKRIGDTCKRGLLLAFMLFYDNLIHERKQPEQREM